MNDNSSSSKNSRDSKEGENGTGESNSNDVPTIPPGPAISGNETIVPGQTLPSKTAGRQVGDYELIEEIARGGMGVVYKAKHRNLNRISAVKMILGGKFSSEEELQRFRIEAESAARLDHPAIVPIFEIGEQEGQAFFAMKYVDGGSLAEHASSYSDRHRDAAQLMIRVAEGVHHAHQRGVLHRDLKPANILVDRNGIPFVTDLGLAKDTAGGSDLTQTGAVLGTPSYMPPEQAAGKSVTTAADIYSLGAILYELISGQSPYRGDTSVSVVMQVINGPPQPPRKINPSIDRDLELICLKAIERKSENRYFSASEFAQDLKAWLVGDPISVEPPSLVAKASNWIKQNQRIAYAIFTLAVGFLVCAPVASSFFSNSLSDVYSEFPNSELPLLYRIRFPKWLAFASSAFLFLIIWPLIGMLNAIISKPASPIKAVYSGMGVAVALSLIFYFLMGWLIVIQSVNNVTKNDANVLARAVWPASEAARDSALKEANELFGGVDHIPIEKRASVISKRLVADRYASAPFALFFGAIAALVFSTPVVYGTYIGHNLLARDNPMWLILLRYLMAWWLLSILLIAIALFIGSFVDDGIQLTSDPKLIPVVFVVEIFLIWLVMRKWKKPPHSPPLSDQ